MRHLSKVLPILVVVAVVALVAWAARDPLAGTTAKNEVGVETSDLAPAVVQVDAFFEQRWQKAGLSPAQPADELQIVRRLSLALLGTIPSLEEIRAFEADERPDRVEHWTRRLLADPRFADYFGERLARGFVGNEGGQFVIFRRDRFTHWLREQLTNNTPYDEVVRTMISATGLWTGHGATNFITAALADDFLDRNKLAGKTVRAFLGQRIDCAQCHDHPFDHWKQHEFEGLAALYGQVEHNLVGVEDRATRGGTTVEFMVEDRKTTQERVVPPSVPFQPDWLPDEGSRRERLAQWVTHPQNRRFERAIANRVWALLFGRAWHEPVDDLPDPHETDRDLLDVLGADFRAHGCDLRRLIQVIAASRPFRLSSEWSVATAGDDKSSLGPELAAFKQAEGEWAVFPLIRLRPEQAIGSIRQSGSIQTADGDSHWVLRALRMLTEGEFVRDYGDLGENELQDRGGTIPQRLLMLNGQRAGDAAKGSPINAAGRIATMASTDEKCVETAYLVCLSRRPSADELSYFVETLRGAQGPARQQAIEDMIWTLFNATEFSWNH
ncbi:MAG: DUF1549 domain-containing protein [Planctomycetaceae bacterium]